MAAAAVPKVAVAAGEKLGRLSHLDRSTWEPLVGTVLETRNRGLARVPLLLVKVGEPATSYSTDKFARRSFFVVFRGPAGQPLADGTHTLFVPGAGKVEIWFSDAHLTGDGWEYVAVFSNSKLTQRPADKPRGRLSRRQRDSVERGERMAERARRDERKRRRRERAEREKLERELSKGE